MRMCSHSERRKTQTTLPSPPSVTSEPVQTQDMDDFMSLGVMSSWHMFGFVKMGMAKESEMNRTGKRRPTDR